jgi:hypothetical protein
MIPFSSEHENDPDQFLHKARRMVCEESGVAVSQIYIVWFSKTLQNWKALLSTAVADGRYYEVTYNGDSEEAYVDTYEKLTNSVYRDRDNYEVPS